MADEPDFEAVDDLGGHMVQPAQARIGGFVVALILAIAAILAGIVILFGKAIGAF
jgi:hypothetical protein